MSRIRTESNDSFLTDNDDFVVVQPSDSGDPANDDDPDSGSEPSTPQPPAVLQKNEINLPSVEFINVQRVYPTDQDIRIRCAMTKPFKFSEMDSIGLYRLGWSDPTEAVASEYVQHVQKVDQFFTNLRSCFLPTNPVYDDYYQFCYVLHDGKTVKGASPPFHLIRSIKNDGVTLQPAPLSEVPLSGASVIPGSSFVAIERPRKNGENGDACLKCTELNSYKNRLDAALQSKALATAELLALQERYDHLNNVFQVQSGDAQDLKQRLDNASNALRALEAEKEQQIKTLHEIMDSLTNKTMELDTAQSRLSEVTEERDNLLAQLMVLQSDRDKVQMENDSLAQQIRVLNEEMSDISMQMADKENWISSITSEMERLSNLVKELKDENEKLKEADKEKNEIINQITTITTDRDCLTKETEAMQEELQVLQNELKNKSEEIASSETIIAQLEEDLNSQIEHSDALEKQVGDGMAREKRLKDTLDQLEGEVTAAKAIADKYTPISTENILESVTEMANNFEVFRESSVKVLELQDGLQMCHKQNDDLQCTNIALQAEVESLMIQNTELRLEKEHLSPQRNSDESSVSDVDVLGRHLPSLMHQLMNISDASPPNTQNVIRELKDMIRFLLTTHERMKMEITNLKKQ